MIDSRISPKPRVALVVDAVDWILGTWCLEFEKAHGDHFDFMMVPIGEIEANPSFCARVFESCDVVHCLTPWAIGRVLPFFDVRSSYRRPLLIATVHHIVHPGQVFHSLRCDAVLTVCGQYRRALVDLGFPESRLGTVRNGVDIQFFAPGDRERARASLGLDAGDFVFGFAAKVSSDHDGRKGVDRFLRLLTLLNARVDRHVTVLTVGPGWDERFAGVRFSNITLRHLGFVDRAILPTFYRALNVYLTTARVEGGPVPVLEAMACGICVYATPVGVVPEIIDDGLNGVIIPFLDDDVALERLAAAVHGHVPLETFGKAARARAVENLTWEVGLRCLPEFYYRVLSLGRLETPVAPLSPMLNDILWRRDMLRWRRSTRGDGTKVRAEVSAPWELDLIREPISVSRKHDPEGVLWSEKVSSFVRSIRSDTPGCFSSVPGDVQTLYGTVYAYQTMAFLGQPMALTDEAKEFVRSCQDTDTGYFVGPELRIFYSKSGVPHDSEHLMLHSTAMALPFCQEAGIAVSSLRAVHRFCQLGYLRCWLDARDLTNAWFEGNNLLFVGQLLVYLRDVEHHPGADTALGTWFDWLDATVDPRTGLWGTNGFCSEMAAVYGGYHQLLVYYHEDRPLPNTQGLVDTVLRLQHEDGGFNPSGNAGACEDVDSVDILVHCYKRDDYRRADIRHALRRCARHILETQNRDGGFPYNRDQPHSHMGIPGTEVPPNRSCTFPTWFRVHTLGLIAQVLPTEPSLRGIPFRFNQNLSMGWHRDPPGWTPICDRVTLEERILDARRAWRSVYHIPSGVTGLGRRVVNRMLRGRLRR